MKRNHELHSTLASGIESGQTPAALGGELRLERAGGQTKTSQKTSQQSQCELDLLTFTRT